MAGTASRSLKKEEGRKMKNIIIALIIFCVTFVTGTPYSTEKVKAQSAEISDDEYVFNTMLALYWKKNISITGTPIPLFPKGKITIRQVFEFSERVPTNMAELSKLLKNRRAANSERRTEVLSLSLILVADGDPNVFKLVSIKTRSKGVSINFEVSKKIVLNLNNVRLATVDPILDGSCDQCISAIHFQMALMILDGYPEPLVNSWAQEACASICSPCSQCLTEFN